MAGFQLYGIVSTKDFKNYKIESNEIDVTIWTDYRYKYDIDCYLNGLTYNGEIPSIYADRLKYYIADHNCTGDTTENGTEINLFGYKGEDKKIIAGCSFEILDYDRAVTDSDYDNNYYIVDIYCPWLTDDYADYITIAIVNLNGGPLLHLMNLNDDPYVYSEEFLYNLNDSGGAILLDPYNVDTSSKTITLSLPARKPIQIWYGLKIISQ